MFRALFPSANHTSTSVEDSLVTLQVGKRVFPNVSPSLRRELWLSVLQRSRAASRAAAAYPALLSSAFPRSSPAIGEGDGDEAKAEGTVPLEVIEAIRRDVGRTFPSVAGFEPEDPSACSSSSSASSSSSSSSWSSTPGSSGLPVPGRRARSLANILIAYAAFDPTVSYCQGMNFLGGLLLIYLDEGDNEGKGKSRRKIRGGGKKKNRNKRSGEENGDNDVGEEEEEEVSGDGFAETLAGDDSAERAAFGLLTHLLMSKGLRALYTEGMEALTARLSHLHLLLPPEIRQLFDEKLEGGVSVTLFAAPWFMTAFASDFPVSIAARLVDAMLTTPPAVDRPLLRLAAACVRACRKELLSSRDAEAAIKVLRRDLPARRLSKLHDLVSEAFEREWSDDELLILSSEDPRLTTEEPKEAGSPSLASSSVSGSAAPLPSQETASSAPSSRGSSPAPPDGKQQHPQHRKLKWEDAMLARRAASVDSEAASEEAAAAASSDGGGGDLLRLPLPPPPPPPPLSLSFSSSSASSALSTPKASETLPAALPAAAASVAAEEALAELLSCRLELDSSSPFSSAPPSPSPVTAAEAAATTAMTTTATRKAPPPLSSDSLWTSFRRAADDERIDEEQEKASSAAAAAVAAAARERAAADLEGWSSFQRSASAKGEGEGEK